MANFWDLPKEVREKIYRLHLVQENQIDWTTHHAVVSTVERSGVASYYTRRALPSLCRLSKKADKEAAPIYYGENHFTFLDRSSGYETWRFAEATYPRHLRLIRKVTIDWPNNSARDAFLAIARMKGLQELNIGVDELDMVRDMTHTRYKMRRWWDEKDKLQPSPQQQLVILRYPGMCGLLTIKGVASVNFVRLSDAKQSKTSGPIPGGFLETEIRPRLMSTLKAATQKKKTGDSFRFLDLPPELRNRIYALLLCFDGPINPSTALPSSAHKQENVRKKTPLTLSALSILAVSHQIHDESVGLFYSNAFEFHYPTHFHAFLLSLGPMRQHALRDITIHYQNTKGSLTGGINLADMTLPMLKYLPNLHRLHIISYDDFSFQHTRSRWFWGSSKYRLDPANPVETPGMRFLFTLRGIKDILVRDTYLEDQVKQIREEEKDTDLIPTTREHFYIELEKIIAFFNVALADAQIGKVNRKILEDDKWHMKTPFPTMEDATVLDVEDEENGEGEGGGEDDEEEEDGGGKDEEEK